MRNILVPMDFTDVGVNALRYALNAFPDSLISVLHIKAGAVETMEPLPITPRLKHELYWTDALQGFIKKELKTNVIPENVSVNIRYGTIIREINNYCTEKKIDTIIMGTRDKYNYFDQWFGTVSMGTVKTANTEVYLIPKYATYKGFRKVMVASDASLSDETFTKKIKTWNKPHNAFVKFLHIQRSKSESFEKEKKAIVSELFAECNPEFSFEVSVLQDKDILHSLLASAYDMNADLLLVIPEDQTFIQSILFKSISKDLILQSDVPLFFIKR